VDLELFKKEYYRYNKDLQKGKIRHKEIWGKLCEELGMEIDIDILYESFINTPIDNQMMEIVNKFKEEGYKVGIVTDNKKDRMDSIIRYYGWNNIFDAITVSAEVGSGKSHNEIFLKTIESLKMEADQCVFIDNQEKNLIVPESMGMKVIYFDHIEREHEKLLNTLRNYI